MSSAPEVAAAGAVRTPGARLSTGLYLGGAALVALAAWLLVPREREGGVPLSICVVDTSASALRLRPSWRAGLSATLLREARGAEDSGSDFAVVAFGADVRRVFGPASPAEYLARVAEHDRALDLFARTSSDTASPLARALRLAQGLALAPGRVHARVVLFTDGTWTGDDPRPLLAELCDAGTSIEVAALPPQEIVDVVLERLVLPRTIEAGAPLVARAQICVSGPELAAAEDVLQLDLVCSGAAGEFARQRTIELPQAAARDARGLVQLAIDVDLGPAVPGRTLVHATARLRGAGGALRADPLPENDTASASVVCSGALIAAVVAPDGVRAQLMRALAPGPGADATGLQLQPVLLADLRRVLADVDVLVTAGVTLRELPRELLEPFLLRGGGWLAIAGPEWLEPLGPGNSLELAPLAPATEGADARDVVLLVDGSGSMAGEPFETVRAALLRLADSAPAEGRIDLSIFGAALGPRLAIRGAVGASGASAPTVRERLSQVLPTSAPGGPTRLFDALEELAREPHVAPRLVVLFSDGRDTSAPDPAARARAVRESLVRARIDLRAIAAGDEADIELLASLLPAGERVIQAGVKDSAALAEIFAREITRERWRVGPALAVLPAASAGEDTLARTILAAQRADDASKWPPIERYLRMRAAPHAELVWVSEPGEPLLALQRVGRGLSAALAFAPIDGWAASWRTQGALFAPLLRALGRAPRAESPWIGERDGQLVIEDLPVDAPAQIEARIVLPPRGATPARELSVLLLPDATAPDPRSVRTAPWPAELDASGDSGLLPVIVSARGAAGPWNLTLEIPRASEFRARPSASADLSAEIAALTHAPRPVAQRAGHPAALLVLAVGLVCLCVAALLGGLWRVLPRSGPA